MGMMGRDWRGTILLDVTVAAFIVSVGLLAILGLFVQNAKVGNGMRQREKAAVLAMEKLELLRGAGAGKVTDEWLLAAAGSESICADRIDYERILTVRPRTDLDSDGQIWEVKIEIRWQDQGQAVHYGLMTYLVLDGDWGNLR